MHRRYHEQDEDNLELVGQYFDASGFFVILRDFSDLFVCCAFDFSHLLFAIICHPVECHHLSIVWRFVCTHET